MGSGALLTLTLVFAETSPAGQDFGPEAKLIERIAACTGEAELPAGIDQAELEAHCAKVRPALDWYRESYVEPARGFITERQPADLPSIVVYPFGAGDLFAALTTYPGAKEITSLSVVRSGDPRRARALFGRRLSASLQRTRDLVKGLLGSREPKISAGSSPRASDLPSALTLSLVALAIHGYEPIGLRYFQLEEDGEIRYLDQTALDRIEREGRKRGRMDDRVSPDESAAFASSELTFVRRGADPNAVEPRIYRHISSVLDDAHLARDPAILRHLEKKGRVVAMAKGSGYLLWQKSYSRLRDYLLKSVDYMVSDSTGLPPSLAYPAGFVAHTFGHFQGAPFPVNRGYERELEALWARESTKALIFRYGHLDRAQNYHLMLLERSPEGTTASFPHPLAAGAKGRVDRYEKIEGARHWRLWTHEGGVHVWAPARYRPSTAGLVIYVHGYFVNVDEAWVEHRLAEQFQASGKNALFLVPEAASSDHDAPVWPELRVLIETVMKLTKLQRPQGSVVALAHSGGFRTVANWLNVPELKDVVLIDGLYGNKQDRFRAWLTADQGHEAHRLILTSTQTADRSVTLAKAVRGSVTLPEIPEDLSVVTKAERKAPLLYMPSQYEHTELVTNGLVIPLVLKLSPLPDS